MDKNAALKLEAGIVPVIDIHRRLRIARDMYDSNLSQDAFGELIGASGNTISNYETGAVSRLKDIYLQKWAEVTGISYWWIKTGLDPAVDTPEGQTKDYQGDVSEVIHVDFARKTREEAC